MTTPTTTTADQARWHDQATCREVDPELSFPEAGGGGRAAKRVCAVCPVRAACLDDALARRDTAYGVLGGLTPSERRELLRQRAELVRSGRRWVA